MLDGVRECECECDCFECDEFLDESDEVEELDNRPEDGDRDEKNIFEVDDGDFDITFE